MLLTIGFKTLSGSFLNYCDEIEPQKKNQKNVTNTFALHCQGVALWECDMFIGFQIAASCQCQGTFNRRWEGTVGTSEAKHWMKHVFWMPATLTVVKQRCKNTNKSWLHRVGLNGKLRGFSYGSVKWICIPLHCESAIWLDWNFALWECHMTGSEKNSNRMNTYTISCPVAFGPSSQFCFLGQWYKGWSLNV